MQFRKWVRGILSFLFLGGLVGVVLFYLLVPPLAERMVLERVRQIPGLENFSLHIRSIGPFGADIQGITTGESLSIDSVHLDYTISSLLEKRIEQVVVAGLDLKGEITPQGPRFVDFSMEKDPNGAPPPATERVGELFALLPETIRVTHSVVSMTMDAHHMRLPLDLSLAVKHTENRVLVLMTLFPFGESVEMAVQATPETGLEIVELKADGFGLAHLQPLADAFAPGITLDGTTDLLISKTLDTDWVVTLSRLGLDKPQALTVSDLVCRIPTISPLSVAGALVLETPMVRPVPIHFTATLGPDKGWNLDVKAANPQPKAYEFVLGDKALVVMDPILDLNVRGKGSLGNIEFTAKVGKCGGEIDAASGSISGITLNARGNFDLEGDHDRLDLTFTAGAGPVKFVSGDLFASAPGLTIPGRLVLDSNFTPRVTVTPTVTGARAGSSSAKVLARDISFTLPVSLPLGEDAQTGRFRIARLIHDKQPVGQLNGTIDQTKDGAIARGRVDLSPILGTDPAPGLDLNLRAWLTPDSSPRIEAEIDFKKQEISSGRIPARYLSNTSDFEFSFFVDAFAKLVFENNQARCGLDMNLTQGQVASEEKNVQVNGINASLGFDDVFAVRSRPGQVVAVDSVKIHDIAIFDAKLNYTLESQDSFLVEQAGFNWCDGRVTTESMRIVASQEDYSLTLFCDRLKLSEILRQVGSFHSEGEGSLNGRIPVTYAKGNIAFNNGFLFSTPGRGGKIRIQGTEILTAGIPKDSPQYTQIDLAREALKDYQYKWAKLAFNTKGETLLVNMEFDGEPENRLPFVYKKEMGGFVRVDASSPGSKFQGIKIDVNLELPFNRVMKFGNQLRNMIN
ncbi:MAG: YdbH domain-containing protein [Desulfobacterium sp.]|nr:YdbH domain-containing protein [Desulfobacterium sp.]